MVDCKGNEYLKLSRFSVLYVDRERAWFARFGVRFGLRFILYSQIKNGKNHMIAFNNFIAIDELQVRWSIPSFKFIAVVTSN